ncbi:MAG: nicotinate (nicotinamide) nucleotide adenylyltransferase [Opitutae bacterium]|nr:nicotinate (nicotinamide) nucleotide adenylyltransferase [Opitutae bacterium]MBT5692094.1 nicotinate (nicotinamide) nucleotide adenylyltransferase [Opitutae bacterium]MBT6461261.1 nicotinate (nicotinamide) nucleotide adenylyltransferase [Opitutae bacterium]MBT7853971.1 nicotinate (nicotinamide) nucleotide adenylyltransferase [Opitutae bacterium]
MLEKITSITHLATKYQFNTYTWYKISAVSMGEPKPLIKTGLLGGSFDPVHTGHLIIALDAMEALGLEEIFFIPAAQAPLKQNDPGAKPHHRKAMLDAVVADNPAYQVLDCELEAGGVSYSIDTIRSLSQKYPERSFFWILGEDQLQKLEKWKDIDELCQLVEFVALDRPDHPMKTPLVIPKSRCHRFCGHLFAISSSEIRERIKNGKSINEFLPANVAKYILDHHLYKN